MLSAIVNLCTVVLFSDGLPRFCHLMGRGFLAHEVVMVYLVSKLSSINFQAGILVPQQMQCTDCWPPGCRLHALKLLSAALLFDVVL